MSLRLRPPSSSTKADTAPRKILVIGEAAEQVRRSLSDVLPHAEIETAATVFDGIADLHANHFDAVVAEVGLIDERPDAATAALNDAGGMAGGMNEHARLLLLADAAHEPLGQDLVEQGAAVDYAMLPPDAEELAALLSGEMPKAKRPGHPPEPSADRPDTAVQPGADPLLPLRRLAVADTFLKAQVMRPGRALQAVVDVLNQTAGEQVSLTLTDSPPAPEPDRLDLRHTVPDSPLTIRLTAPPTTDKEDARAFFTRLANNLEQVARLDHRQESLQRLAYFDDLTGIHNGRYFRWFLHRILDRARKNYFPVTLLLFDIDNFKQYNDKYGHSTGDEILRQTARLMRRCCREHDCVARVSGDEFAVIFWEKEGPRQPHDPDAATTNRVPQTPLAIANRFRRLLSDSDFPALGESGRGKLTISGGMAVFPYDSQTAEDLIEAADQALMFNAKTHGKNSIALISGQNGNGHP